MAPFQAALKGSREVGFTILSISISLVAVFIPIFFMPGVIGLLFHEFAVVVSLAILVSAFVSLTLVPMLASRYLKRRGAHEAAGRHRAPRSSAPSTRCSARYARALDVALRHRGPVLLVALGTFVAERAGCSSIIPKGFFPEEDIGQIRVGTEASEDISFPAMVALQAQVADDRAGRPERRHGQLLPRRRQQHANTGRMFVNLKPRGERQPMEQVVEELRRKVRAVPGIAVYPTPIQNLRARRARQQEPLPVRAAEREGRRAERLGREAAGQAARRPGLPRRHQRLAAEGPAGAARHRPRPRQHARRADRRRAHRAVQRLRRAPGLDHLHRRPTATR